MRGQNSQNMGVGEERHVPIGARGTIDDGLRARINLADGFSVGRLGIPDRPVRNFLADLIGGAAFIIAVVPLAQVWLDLRSVSEARQAARFASPLQGAGEDEGKMAI